ncbi:hypothetical protein CYMTET_30090 [Cymbomonas tetramitiformis]|uniref:Uncharacterized protein n=1 Tax=Cymbomonas tetramitiformis TaxID=36881 RepID=A0AAE0FK62_9CHLO|nr:hypothetical protein CYMTET_30090 [Cymbomonas tetramitiformis]
MIACFIGLLAFGIAGAAAGLGGSGIDGIDNNMGDFNSDRLLQVIGSALTAETRGFSGEGMAAEASVYGGVATTGEP